MIFQKPLRNLRIFSGTSHPALAGAIAEKIGVPLSMMHVSRFASNEIYAKPEVSVRGQDVYIVQTCTRDVNEDLMELFIMIDALKRSFAGKIHVVIPHFGYSRQDRVASPREPITAKLVAHLLAAAGADHVISVQFHSAQTQGFFQMPVDNLNPRKLFVEHIKKQKLKDIVVVAPDAGAAKDASKFARELDAPLAILTKERPEFNMAEVTSVVGEVKGKTCILIDDMIDTAGSVCAAKEALMLRGAHPDVYLVATHPVFSGPALERLQNANFKEIIVTDTIPLKKSLRFPELTFLSIAPLLSDVIRCVHENRSVTDVM